MYQFLKYVMKLTGSVNPALCSVIQYLHCNLNKTFNMHCFLKEIKALKKGKII